MCPIRQHDPPSRVHSAQEMAAVQHVPGKQVAKVVYGEGR